jgi:hypothetical protein
MLISEDRLSEEVRKHITDPEYGGESVQWAAQISQAINALQAEDVLDYGAGKGELHRHLVLDHRVALHLYDPAIKQISEPPEPHEMTLCINVLDCVESDCLYEVLDDLKRCTKKATFIVIREDERDMEWWLGKITARFRIESLVRSDMDFFIIASARDEH